MTKYNIAIDGDGEGAVSIFDQGEAITIQRDHPNFLRIVAALVEGEDVAPFLNIAKAVTAIDERVSVDRDTIQFEGVPVHDVVSRTIMRYQREGRPTEGVVRFMERLKLNPSNRAVETLFGWVQDRELTITEDGCFIGWKGVSGEMKSLTRGKAFVNDELFEGNIPNDVGSVVSMPRNEVRDDPGVSCSVGLHVGTYEYAKGFGPVLLEVKVAPEDVVSVPQGSETWKIRCCRYEVLCIHEREDDTFEEEYEPEAEWDDGEGVDVLAPVVPESFLGKLRKHFGSR